VPGWRLRLERFLDPAQLDPALFSGRSLYLLPDGPAAERGYDVLRDTMRQRCRWAIGRVVLGGHRNVVLLRPATTTLVMHVLHYPEMVRACPARPATTSNPAATSEEYRLAGLLIDAASGTVEWRAYQDESAAELRALVETKLQGQESHPDEPRRGRRQTPRFRLPPQPALARVAQDQNHAGRATSQNSFPEPKCHAAPCAI
jgi:DNA end-binding protein Ku